MFKVIYKQTIANKSFIHMCDVTTMFYDSFVMCDTKSNILLCNYSYKRRILRIVHYNLYTMAEFNYISKLGKPSQPYPTTTRMTN